MGGAPDLVAKERPVLFALVSTVSPSHLVCIWVARFRILLMHATGDQAIALVSTVITIVIKVTAEDPVVILIAQAIAAAMTQKAMDAIGTMTADTTMDMVATRMNNLVVMKMRDCRQRGTLCSL